MINKKEINHRGKVLSQLINLKDAYKDKDKVLSGYVGGIIDSVLSGWEKNTIVDNKKS